MEKQLPSWIYGGSRLVLILSSERSGSTLLRVMLGEHSRLVAPAELWLMAFPDYETWRREKPLAIESLVEYFDLVGQPRDEAQIEADFVGIKTIDVYRRLLRLLPEGKAFVDKTPGYANRMESLRRSRELDPFYIWLIRHPLGVIDSHVGLVEKKDGAAGLRGLARKAIGWLEGINRNGMTSVARQREIKWYKQNLNICELLASISEDRKATVYFEKLVSAPAAAMKELCEKFGMAAEERMWTFPHQGRVMLRGLGDRNFHTHSSIEPEIADRWKTRFSEAQLRTETLELMRLIGVSS